MSIIEYRWGSSINIYIFFIHNDGVPCSGLNDDVSGSRNLAHLGRA